MRSLSDTYLTDLLANAEIRDALEKTMGTAALEAIVELDAARILPVPPVVESTLMESTLVAEAAVPPVPVDPTPGLSDTLLRAATSYNFDLGAIAPQDGADRAWLLRQSALATTPDAKHLRLSGSERQRVLNAPEAAAQLAALLKQSESADRTTLEAATDTDRLADAYLRHFLRGHGTTEELMRIASHRRAITAAREELEGVENLAAAVPSLARCRRSAGLAEILTPLGILIGVDPDQAHQSEGDRFVGRADELRILRSLVDVLRSQSALESVSRGYDRFRRGFGQRPRLMTLVARGGLGKTALMAKFLYDHATSAEQQFPFAYLDFDRSDIQPRSAGLMLLEICRQLSFQYAGLEQPLQQLSQEIRSMLAGRETASLNAWCRELRHIVEDGPLDYGAATFLVVLDTMELVEPDAAAMEGVATLLRALAGPPDDPFGALCIVAAGRSGLDQLVTGETYEIKPLPLKALSVEDARAMVERLGQKLLGPQWNNGWSNRIAGKKHDPEARREPLSLRIAVEMVRDTDPAGRETVVADIARLGEKASDNFVAGLYERRILDHVRDERARKLAWPGLVARKVTRTIARDVLAPVCGLTADEADAAFTLLSREGWLVEGVPGGDTIRHRRELRARTLPLMRRHSPIKFGDVVEALIAFHAGSDPVEHAYYRLLRGHEGEIYHDPQLSNQVAAMAADIDDFEQGSPAWNLIQAKTATRSLDLQQMSTLPETLLWEHLGRTGTGLRSMNDRRIEPRVRMMIRRGKPTGFNDPFQESAWQAIQIKCGFWSRLDPDGLITPALQFDLTQFAFYIVQLSLSGERPVESWGWRYLSLMEPLYANGGGDNWHALTLSLATAKLYDRQLFDHIENRLVEPLAGASGQGRMRESSLRTLMLVGVETQPIAFQLWIKSEIDRIAQGISLAEYAVLAFWAGERITPERSATRNQRGHANMHRRVVEAGTIEDIPAQILKDIDACADARELLEDIGNLSSEQRIRQFARHYCSVRQPEWVVPFAYLLDALLPETWRQQVGHDLSSDRYDPSSQSFLSQATSLLRRPRMPSDMMELLTLADRAGDFDRVVQRLCALVDPGQADIHQLNRIRQAARARIFNVEIDPPLHA